jgi:hypothetical protein
MVNESGSPQALRAIVRQALAHAQQDYFAVGITRGYLIAPGAICCVMYEATTAWTQMHAGGFQRGRGLH